MAKYNEYLESGDIGAEIDDAASNKQARDAQGRFIPDRFQGKEIGDVIQSFEELEKLNSRQANDLGDMRKTVDQLLELNLQHSSPAEEKASPLSADDLYADPDAAVRRVVREESSTEIKSLKDEVQQLRTERLLGDLENKYPSWQEKSNSPEFKAWTEESPYRTRIAQDAAKGDFDAAEEILGMYYDSIAKPASQEAAPGVSVADAQLERSGPIPVEMEDTYSRNELLEVRMAAKRGDQKAERWLKAHADGIAQAYAENRIVD